jgi:hypothetical protein
MWLGCEREGEVTDVPSVSWMYMLVTIGNQTSHVKGALYRYVLLNTRACTSLAPPSASSGPILFFSLFLQTNQIKRSLVVTESVGIARETGREETEHTEK